MAEISMQKSSLRIEWIDVCKGLGIFLVVIGHTSIAQISQTVYNWIYSFHMPMFYMLSGMMLNDSKYSDFRSYIKTIKNINYSVLLLEYTGMVDSERT